MRDVAEAIYQTLKLGTAEQRQEFGRGLPTSPFKDVALPLLGSDQPGMVIVALGPSAIAYSSGSAPEVGAPLAFALHRYAVELFLKTSDHGLLPTTLSALAVAYVRASNLLGHLEDVLAFTDACIPFYEELGDTANLPTLKLGRVEALLNLRRVDEAVATLKEPGLAGNLATDIELKRLIARMQDLRNPIMGDRSDDSASVFSNLGLPDQAAAGGPYTPEETYDTLGVGRGSVRRGQTSKAPPSGVPPAKPPPTVNTGFANPSHPGGHLAKSRPIVPGERYYFWLQVGDAPGSIEEQPTPLPVELLPSEARLVVILFSPDGGFRQEAGADMGELVLNSDGSARVVAQPGAYNEEGRREEDINRFDRRLLFPVIAPPTPGEYRLRCSIYCQGVLVQSRIVTVEVGGIRRLSRLDYSLASRLEASKLQTLAEHRFSMLSNHRPDGNHDFYIYGGNGKRAFRDALTIPAKTVDDALQLAHAAMRRASWGDEEPWASTKKYRYGGPPALETLRHDLAVLAIAGYRIYDLLANQLAGGEAKVDEFTALVREPGLVQISPDADLGMVLPAALIYDYEVELGTALPKFRLCPGFERAYREKTPLQDTACFQGNCPIRGEDTSVCPSGFWGFRHGLGLPISDSTAGKTAEADFNVRLEYGEIPVIIVGVSRSRDLPRTKEHTEELQALRPAWGNKGWLVVDQRNPLLELMRSKQPHVVYFYCHGSGRQVGSIEIPMLYLGENPEAAQPGEWLERATLRKKIRWTKPRPLVFLNGCRTTVLTAKTTLDFVTGFVQNAKACGVVGTEVTVFEPLAGEFARRFLERFLSGIPVGQAIRDTRLDLLQQGNPLGLVYTPFVLSGTQLVRTGG